MSAAKAYFKSLYGLGHGSPLWLPESDVSLLDVGFLHEGGFFFLFNAALPHDHRCQVNGVPDGFEPLQIPPIFRKSHSKMFDPMFLHSSTVTSTEINAEITSEYAGAGAGVKFECSEEHGAVLVTKEKTTRDDYLDNEYAHRYICKHVDSWYAFASSLGFRLRGNPIIMVQGADRTADWALAAFTGNRRERGIFFQGGYTAVGGVKLSVRGSWNSLTPVEHRSGPDRGTPASEDVGSVTEGVAGASSQPSSSQPKLDQCIFLRSWHIQRRRFGAPKIIKAAAEPRQYTPDRDGDDPPHPVLAVETPETDVLIETESGDSCIGHPVDAALDWILAHSDARVAIVTDNDLLPLFEDCGDADNLSTRIANLAPHIVVDREGAGSVIFDEEPVVQPALQEPESLTMSVETLRTIEAGDGNTSVRSITPLRPKASPSTLNKPRTRYVGADVGDGRALGGHSITQAPSDSTLTIVNRSSPGPQHKRTASICPSAKDEESISVGQLGDWEDLIDPARDTHVVPLLGLITCLQDCAARDGIHSSSDLEEAHDLDGLTSEADPWVLIGCQGASCALEECAYRGLDVCEDPWTIVEQPDEENLQPSLSDIADRLPISAEMRRIPGPERRPRSIHPAFSSRCRSLPTTVQRSGDSTPIIGGPVVDMDSDHASPNSYGSYSAVFIGDWTDETQAKLAQVFRPGIGESNVATRDVKSNRRLGLAVRGTSSDSMLRNIAATSSMSRKRLWFLRQIRSKANAIDKLLLGHSKCLAWLHSRDIIHGDIRAGNVLVDEDDHVVLANFALHPTSDDNGGTPAVTSSLRWQAPELLPWVLLLETEDSTPAASNRPFLDHSSSRWTTSDHPNLGIPHLSEGSDMCIALWSIDEDDPRGTASGASVGEDLVAPVQPNFLNADCWMSSRPSQDRSPAATQASDVWRFAMLCLEVYTLKPPFSDVADDWDVGLKVSQGCRPERPSPDECQGLKISDELWALMTSCWSQNPADRPRAAEVLDRMQELVLM